MQSKNSNPSVENLITESALAANEKVQKSEDRFYIVLTTIGLIGLATLLFLALG